MDFLEKISSFNKLENQFSNAVSSFLTTALIPLGQISGAFLTTVVFNLGSFNLKNTVDHLKINLKELNLTLRSKKVLTIESSVDNTTEVNTDNKTNFTLPDFSNTTEVSRFNLTNISKSLKKLPPSVVVKMQLILSAIMFIWSFLVVLIIWLFNWATFRIYLTLRFTYAHTRIFINYLCTRHLIHPTRRNSALVRNINAQVRDIFAPPLGFMNYHAFTFRDNLRFYFTNGIYVPFIYPFTPYYIIPRIRLYIRDRTQLAIEDLNQLRHRVTRTQDLLSMQVLDAARVRSIYGHALPTD